MTIVFQMLPNIKFEYCLTSAEEGSLVYGHVEDRVFQGVIHSQG